MTQDTLTSIEKHVNQARDELLSIMDYNNDLLVYLLEHLTYAKGNIKSYKDIHYRMSA